MLAPTANVGISGATGLSFLSDLDQSINVFGLLGGVGGGLGLVSGFASFLGIVFLAACICLIVAGALILKNKMSYIPLAIDAFILAALLVVISFVVLSSSFDVITVPLFAYVFIALGVVFLMFNVNAPDLSACKKTETRPFGREADCGSVSRSGQW